MLPHIQFTGNPSLYVRHGANGEATNYSRVWPPGKVDMHQQPDDFLPAKRALHKWVNDVEAQASSAAAANVKVLQKLTDLVGFAFIAFSEAPND